MFEILFLIDFNPNVARTVDENSPILQGDSVVYNCSLQDIPELTVSSITISWISESGQILIETAGASFLLLELTDLKTSNSGLYTCLVEINSNSTDQLVFNSTIRLFVQG